MIHILILAILLGIMIAGIMAPIKVAKDRKIIKEMEDILKQWAALDREKKEFTRDEVMQKLIGLSIKIYSKDRDATYKADLILRAVK